MPKRDPDYMATQRQAIAAAAHRVLMEKGYHGTSLRDICRTAEVSKGALYLHFPTRESVILAATMVAYEDILLGEVPDDWNGYVAFLLDEANANDTNRAKKIRLALEMGAEQVVAEENIDGVLAIYRCHLDFVRRTLLRLRERGVIRLPFDAGLTAEMHVQAAMGASLRLAMLKNVDHQMMRDALLASLALSAGLVEGDERL